MGKFLVFIIVVLLSTSAEAARRPKKKRQRRPAPTPSGPVTVPIEVGAGPVALLPSPPALLEQPLHFGLQIEAAAIVDQALIRKYRGQMPAWARGAAGNVNEARIRPWFLAIIPHTLIISPQLKDTGMYGAIWRPFGLSIPLIDHGLTVDAGGAISAVALLVHSNVLGVPAGQTGHAYTFVLRPGIQLHMTGTIPLGDALRVSFGWSSDLFIPQPYGKAPWEIAPLEDSLWHLGGPFLRVAYRFPYEFTP